MSSISQINGIIVCVLFAFSLESIILVNFLSTHALYHNLLYYDNIYELFYDFKKYLSHLTV